MATITLGYIKDYTRNDKDTTINEHLVFAFCLSSLQRLRSF